MSKLDDYIWYLKKLAANGGPYSPWSGEWPPSPGPPFYLDSGDYSYDYVAKWGADCAGLMNLPLWWVDLKAVGGTLAWGELLKPGSWYERFQSGKAYPVGTFLLQPYGEGAGGEGHIAVVISPDGTIAQADTYYGINAKKTAAQQAYYTPWSYAFFHPDLIPPEARDPGNPSKPLGKYDYPGDCADPDVVARYFARIAHDKYGLPPELPVMTSYVELTSAWTSPGCVYNIPGYSYAVDYSSLGYFQQRPEWWGTPDQLRDAEYALAAFCKAAAQYKGQYDNDPTSLGAWCQAVQNSGYPERYAQAYAAAVKLIAGWDTEYSDEKPEPGPEPRPKPHPEGELTQWEKWGWYEWPSDESWDLKYHPPEGRDSPVPDPEPKVYKARSKPREVEYYVKDGKYVVMLGEGSEITYSENEFKEKYEEV